MSVSLMFDFLNVLVQVFISALHLNSPLFFSSLRIKEELYTYEKVGKIYMCLLMFSFRRCNKILNHMICVFCSLSPQSV